MAASPHAWVRERESSAFPPRLTGPKLLLAIELRLGGHGAAAGANMCACTHPPRGRPTFTVPGHPLGGCGSVVHGTRPGPPAASTSTTSRLALQLTLQDRDSCVPGLPVSFPLCVGLMSLGASWFCPCRGGGSSGSAEHHPKSGAIPGAGWSERQMGGHADEAAGGPDTARQRSTAQHRNSTRPRRMARPAACRRRPCRPRPGATRASRGREAHLQLPRPSAPPHCPTPTRPPGPGRRRQLRACMPHTRQHGRARRGACSHDACGMHALHEPLARDNYAAATAPWLAVSPPAPAAPCVGRSGAAFSGACSSTSRSLAEEAPQPIVNASPAAAATSTRT